mmetsp:Transcript_10139/g.14328  ORF Transcript_10139/g.14328 Transcript_10139/m.14328 type:complete len:155 (+) Transcript_10139:178-642(+)
MKECSNLNEIFPSFTQKNSEIKKIVGNVESILEDYKKLSFENGKFNRPKSICIGFNETEKRLKKCIEKNQKITKIFISHSLPKHLELKVSEIIELGKKADVPVVTVQMDSTKLGKFLGCKKAACFCVFKSEVVESITDVETEYMIGRLDRLDAD